MRVALGACVGCWMAIAAPSAAIPPAYREFEGLQIESFEIRGVDSDLEDELEKGLALATPSKLLKSRSTVFHAKVLEEDRQRTLLFMAQRGYPHTEVTPKVKRAKGQKVEVTLILRTGPPVRIHAFAMEGMGPDLEGKARKALESSHGEVVVDAAIRQVAQKVEGALREDGYALAKVAAHVDPIDSVRVAVRLVASPGDRYVFGAARVSGVAPDLVPLAVRTLDIPPGTPYAPERIKDAQDNLRLLDIFRQIRITTAPAGPETLDVVAQLSARDPHTVEARAGYMSEDLFRARMRWAGHNTFQGGRGLEATASYSQFHQEVKASVWWPALIGPRTREVFTIRGLRDDEDSYSEVGGGIQVASWYRKSFRTTYRIYTDFGYVKADFTSQYEDDFEGLMTVLGVSWSRDTSDDRLRPTRGFVAWAEGKLAPEFLPAAAPFVRGEAGTSFYLPLPRRAVLAQRMVIGLAAPFDEAHRLLPSLRFYAGGINSNRGFERRMLGPLYPDEEPAGGEARLESLTEIRIPLIWRLSGAVFFDLGQVWSRVETMKLDGLEPSAGGALMIDTPIGPIRGDIGYRLGDHGDQPGHVFHFLIGHPF